MRNTVRRSALSWLPVLFCCLTATGSVQSSISADYPDTEGFTADLASYAGLPDAEREQRAATAERLIQPWLKDFQVRDGRVVKSVNLALAHQCMLRARAHTFSAETPNILGPALAALAQALALDPTRDEARVALGLSLVQSGRHREGIAHLNKALLHLDTIRAEPGSEPALRCDHLRERSFYYLALGYRDSSQWERGLAAVAAAAEYGPTPALKVLRGLCLAGAGKTSEAISYAVRMEPLEFRHQTALSSGMYARPSDYANRWIKSQALFSEGNLSGARHVLGNLKVNRARRLPFYHRFWQDAGLICELLQDPEALTHYNMIAWHSLMGWAYPVTGHLMAPLVLGFPDPKLPVFISPDEEYRGGSPFGYLARQLDLMAGAPDTPAATAATDRALELCGVLLRRHIRPDLVRAFRARIYLATDQPALAYADLVFARDGFAARDLVDAGTSSLLGHQELLAGNNERSRALYAEAVAAMPDNALAWRDLVWRWIGPGIPVGPGRQ